MEVLAGDLVYLGFPIERTSNKTRSAKKGPADELQNRQKIVSSNILCRKMEEGGTRRRNSGVKDETRKLAK